MNSNRTVFRDERGFTLIEMMLVVLIMGTLGAMAVVVGPNFAKQARSDAGSVQVMETLRTAREIAISQRRNVQILFTNSNTIQVWREEIDIPPVVPARLTFVRTVVLEGRVEFTLASGVPDTPDRFGCVAGSTVITAPCGTPAAAIALGPSLTRAFTSEGTLVDSNGDPMNGTVFMSVPTVKNSARAITLFGTTGLMRTWRWNGTGWVE